MKRTVIVTMIALVVAGFATADQGLTEIGPTTSFPIVIDTPGSYVLTADLHVTAAGVNGIQIDVDNVTLDLGGHVVRGPGKASAGHGIYGNSRNNITIRNGTVTGFDYGIFLEDSASRGLRFSDLTASHCHIGLLFHNGSVKDVVVHNNTIESSSLGMSLRCYHCSVINVQARENDFGIYVDVGTVQNCTSNDNFREGFRLNLTSMAGGSAFRNDSHGVDAEFGCAVIGVSVSDNEGWGIDLRASGGNNVMNCAGYGNDLGGISNCGAGNGNGCGQNFMH
ncbi:MAG: hypothetical protein GY906_35265 [bacterium]|nr:hypothetical protein [bacterium]